MAEDKASGLASAVASTIDDALPPVAAAHQLPLLPSDQIAALPADKAERMALLTAPRRAGPGRPAGAKNRKTQDWANFILARYPSPLVGLAEIATRPTRLLAEEVGCKPVEALAIQQRALAELAPYLHGKMPVEVNLAVELPTLALVPPEVALAAFQQQMGGEGALDLASIEIVENQEVGEGGAGRVGQSELDSGAESQEICASQPDARLISDQPGKAAEVASDAQDERARAIPPQPCASVCHPSQKSLPEVPVDPEAGPRFEKLGEGAGTADEGEGAS